MKKNVRGGIGVFLLYAATVGFAYPHVESGVSKFALACYSLPLFFIGLVSLIGFVYLLFSGDLKSVVIKCFMEKEL